MGLVIEEFDMANMEFTTLGRIEDGEVVSDESGFLSELLDGEDLSDEEALLERFNGPSLIAHPGTSSIGKSWIPYEGPRGGEGWQNVEDRNEIVYQEEPPGEVHPDYEADHWEQYPSDNDWPDDPFGTGWQDPPGYGRDAGMRERDAIAFINYEDEIQVGRIRDFQPEDRRYKLENGYVVNQSQVVGWSPLPEDHFIETSSGVVEIDDWIKYEASDGEHYTGRITDIEINEGHDVISVVGDGGYHEIEVTGGQDPTEYNGEIFTVHDDTPDLFENVEENGMAMEADEVAAEIEEMVDLSVETHPRANPQLDREERKQIRRALNRYFPDRYVKSYYDAVSRWKIDNTDRGPSEKHEVAFKEAADIESPTHVEALQGKDPMDPDPAHTKIAKVMDDLSDRFWEENFGGRETVYRGISNTAFSDLFPQWLENPTATKYELEQLALNNYSLEFETAAGFGTHTAVVAVNADTDDVVLCTDAISNIGTVEDEHEVQIHGDGHEVDSRDIRLFGRDGPSLGDHPKDWFRNEHVTFGRQMGNWYMNRVGNALDEDDGETPLPEDQYKTLLEWTRVMKEEYNDLLDEDHVLADTVKEIREDARLYYGLGDAADHPDQSSFDEFEKSDIRPTIDLTNAEDARWLSDAGEKPQREQLSPELFRELVERNRARRRELSTDTEDPRSDSTRLKGRVEIGKLRYPEENVSESTLEKAGENFREVDDLLIEAWEKQVCADSLEKAPNMWRQADNIPQFVRTFVKQAASKRDALWDTYNDVPHMAALRVHEIIKDNLTNSSGWSIETIANDLTDEFEGISQNQAETIARSEVAAVLNKARSMAYDASGEELQFYWSGPSDEHTTDICEETKAEIESRGGYVDKGTLQKILRRKARKYRDDGGTPERVNSFLPHFNCRHTLVRSEFKFL